MLVGVTASQQPYTVLAPTRCAFSSRRSHDRRSSLKLFSSGLHKLPKISFNSRCNCAGDSGDNESKTVLDAFFMGKAVGEELNVRIESAVGEFLSKLGRLQAEQQKQVQEFQEEVSEKARRAKEQAARKVMEARGLTPKSIEKTPSVNGFAVNASSVSDSVTSADSSSESKSTSEDPQHEHDE